MLDCFGQFNFDINTGFRGKTANCQIVGQIGLATILLDNLIILKNDEEKK